MAPAAALQQISPRSESMSPLQRVSTFKSSTPTASSALSGAASVPSTLDSFSRDPILSPFLSQDFSSVSFSSAALSSGSPASTVEHLHQAIRLLEGQLRSEVLSRHNDLLNQLSSLKHAEHALSTIRSAVSSLQSSVHRARSELSEPHEVIRLKTTQLSNLHNTTELLQHSIRALRHSSKLRDLTSLSGEKLDLAKAAQLHGEILSLCDEYNLAGIHVVDEELKWVKETGETLRVEAMRVLQAGIEGLNQAEVGTGLQVFYNLGELKVTVMQIVDKYKNTGVKSITSALDIKAISAGPKSKEAIWQKLNSTMDQLHSIVVAIWHLQRVLSKKRDPFTHELLLDEVLKEGDPTLTTKVWDSIVRSLATQMKSSFNASPFVKEVLSNGYPKLFSMVENLLERVSNDTEVKGVLPAINPQGKQQMIEAIEIFQTSFLASSLGRLTDTINTLFPVSRGNVPVPNKEHISKIISRIQEEIESVHFNPHLTLMVLKQVGKSLRLLAQRAECQIATGIEARQITAPATASQLKNFSLSHHLQEMHSQISSISSDDILMPSLSSIFEIAHDAVYPLFKSIGDHLESCVLRLHEHAFSDETSPYMDFLQSSLANLHANLLTKLLPSPISANLTRATASRLVTLFIRHCALLRPLPETAKLRMARDMAELELALSQRLFPVQQLGPCYRALRAFRPLIFLETPHMGSSSLLQDLPVSIVLHHLYSRAPDELQSPMQRNMLSPQQYSLWWDGQSEDQIWRGVKTTLDDYALKVRSRGDKEFSPVYPLMLQLGSVFESSSSFNK